MTSQSAFLTILPISQSAERVKRALAVEFGIPILPSSPGLDGVDPARTNSLKSGAARRAALALQKELTPGSSAPSTPVPRIPKERVVALEAIIKTFLGRDPMAEPVGLRPGDLEAALMEGLGPRKMKRHLLTSSAVATGDPVDGPLSRGGGIMTGRGSNIDDDRLDEVLEGTQSLENLLHDLESNTITPSASKAQPHAATESRGGIWWHGEQIVRAALARGGEAALLSISKW